MIAPDAPHQQRRHWVQAAMMSLLLHGAAVAALLHDRAPDPSDRPDPAAQIQVRTQMPAAQADTAPDPVAPDPLRPPAIPDRPTQPATFIVTEAEQWAVITRPRPTLPPPAAQVPQTAPDSPRQMRAAAADSQPPDPRLTPLIEAIRDRLDQPCLIALPQIGPQDGMGLTVLADNERAIARILLDLAGLRPDPAQDRRVLLDPRQCPAIIFARRSPTYPVFPLAISLEQQDLNSGAEMRVRVAAPAGHDTTLLLVDDNGVMQNLRRFRQVEGEVAHFDVPVARADAARDTSQVLIAIASPAPIGALTSYDGRLAQDAFHALEAETAQGALIGVSSLYLR